MEGKLQSMIRLGLQRWTEVVCVSRASSGVCIQGLNTYFFPAGYHSTLRSVIILGMRGSRGGTGGPDPPPPWNLKILPKKKVISGFLGGWTPLVCDQNLPFSLDPLS